MAVPAHTYSLDSTWRTEPNSFFRAFKSWTGLTPERVRRERRQRTNASVA